MNEIRDCIVVGGGAAGLSAALVLGRARRSTLVIDAGSQSNLPAHGIGGALGHDGRAPVELYAMGREELTAYPSVEVLDGTAVDAQVIDGGFEVTHEDGTTTRSRTIVLALGMDYLRPELPGIEERWGSAVFHCPFCHGWEVRGKALAVLDPGPMGAMRARLLRAWSEDVTLLVDGSDGPSPEERAQLTELDITVEDREVVAVHGPEGDLTEVELADGARVACGGLMIAAALRQRTDLATRLGAQTTSTPMADDILVIDHLGQTTVPGVWAAGDTAGVMPSVVNVIATGSTAAAQVVHHLVLS